MYFAQARRVASKSNGRDTLVAGILGCAAALSLQACVSLEALAAPCVLTQAGDLEFCEIKVGKGPAVKTGNTVELVYQVTVCNITINFPGGLCTTAVEHM
jgi:hypothetical protein